MARVFLIKTTESNEYYFVLKDDNNETTLCGREFYKTIKSCCRGIESLKLFATENGNYAKLNDEGGRLTFHLLGRGQEIIGAGMSYRSIAARDKGIANVKCCALNAPIFNDLLR